VIKNKNPPLPLSLSLSLYTIVIKPGPELTWSRDRIPGFMGQSGSTQVNPKKLKKIKVLIFYMKKSM
jgi:hypothetical protein